MINETLMHQIMLRMLLVINAEVQEALEEVPNLATCFGKLDNFLIAAQTVRRERLNTLSII